MALVLLSQQINIVKMLILYDSGENKFCNCLRIFMNLEKKVILL